MKALTIWQPWASLIMGTCTLSEDAMADGFTLPKDVENRTWPTGHRGPMLVHAGKRVDQDWMYLINEEALPTGVILGVVDVIRMNQFSCSDWAAQDQWHWELENPRPFVTPIPYKGAQGLFDVPDHVIAAAMREMKAVMP